MEFRDLALEVNREAMRQERYDRFAEEFPGWEPARGDLLTTLIDSEVDQVADLTELTVDVSASVFDFFGEKIVGVPRILAAAATVQSTWTMVDDAGYTIPAGTLVSIAETGSTAYAFEVLTEVLVLPGDTATDAGEVTLSAVLPGVGPNGLSSTPALIDALSYVDSIALVGSVAGGVDEESGADYLDRLVEEMRLLAPRPILARDAAILARRVPGVWRATAIDGLDPDDGSLDNERMVTVAAVDEDGVGVSAGIKTDIEELLESLREANFIFNVIDPTSSTIKVSVTAVALDGFDTATVETSIEAAIAEYLDPANWGFTGGDVHSWRNVTTVRRFELISLVDRVSGVDYVTALTLAKGGASLATSDVTLDGYAALPTPGVISATVS